MAQCIADSRGDNVSIGDGGSDSLPPLTADSTTDEVVHHLLSRLQQLENRVISQDATIRTLQRSLVDNKEANMEM